MENLCWPIVVRSVYADNFVTKTFSWSTSVRSGVLASELVSNTICIQTASTKLQTYSFQPINRDANCRPKDHSITCKNILSLFERYDSYCALGCIEDANPRSITCGGSLVWIEGEGRTCFTPWRGDPSYKCKVASPPQRQKWAIIDFKKAAIACVAGLKCRQLVITPMQMQPGLSLRRRLQWHFKMPNTVVTEFCSSGGARLSNQPLCQFKFNRFQPNLQSIQQLALKMSNKKLVHLPSCLRRFYQLASMHSHQYHLMDNVASLSRMQRFEQQYSHLSTPTCMQYVLLNFQINGAVKY